MPTSMPLPEMLALYAITISPRGHLPATVPAG